MPKISAYTILFHDLQFYEDVVRRVYDQVDEIVVVDGPYAYAVDTLKKLGLFYDETTRPEALTQLLHAYPKLKYVYAVCDTEEEKRILGFQACTHDLVLLLDTDEFLTLDPRALDRFVRNPRVFVGGVDIYNMCDVDVAFNPKVQKFILFKRPTISAVEHLDYLWLVGCKQSEKRTEYMCLQSVGLDYHFTLNRNKANNAVKFLFYKMLWRKNNHRLDRPWFDLDQCDLDTLLAWFSPEEFLALLVHSLLPGINVPTVANSRLYALGPEHEEALRPMQKYRANHAEFVCPRRWKVLAGMTVFARLPSKRGGYVLRLTNAASVRIQVHCAGLGANHPLASAQFDQTGLSHDAAVDLVLPPALVDDRVAFLYFELQCTQTHTSHPVITLGLAD